MMASKIFLSWQSDDRAQTRELRRSIDKAIERVNQKYNTDYERDEATRKLPGSPEIKTAIMEKIEDAAIVIADVTLVAETSPRRTLFGRRMWKRNERRRFHSNSNVMYELGYAKAFLGSSRIVLVCGGSFDGLPFDVAGYRTAALDSKTEDTIYNAILAIHKHDPRPEWKTRCLAPASRENSRRNVEGYLTNMPPAMIADSAVRLPGFLDRRISLALDDLQHRSWNPHAQMPPELQLKADEFADYLSRIVDLTIEHYLDTRGPLVRAPKEHEDSEMDSIRAEVDKLRMQMVQAHDAFVTLARDEYPEIDFDTIGKQADSHYSEAG